MLVRIVAALALLTTTTAHAGFITLEIEARFVAFSNGWDQFYADTGIAPQAPFNWTGRITLDTAAAPDTVSYPNGSLFNFDGAGSRMTATVGNVTVTHDAFTLLVAQEGDCDRLIIGAIDFSASPAKAASASASSSRDSWSGISASSAAQNSDLRRWSSISSTSWLSVRCAALAASRRRSRTTRDTLIVAISVMSRR